MNSMSLIKEKSWYTIENDQDYDSPALLIYPQRVKENIQMLLAKVDVKILRPHVKTNKNAEVCNLMMEAGIRKFKAATIAEAEMLALIKAPDVLIAYPFTQVKLLRLIRLMKKYPDTKFSFLVDNLENLPSIKEVFLNAGLIAFVYVDINVGMNRTGIAPEKALALFQQMQTISCIQFLGFHAYDGHIKDPDPDLRAKSCFLAFQPVVELKKKLETILDYPIVLIAGGTPTCFIHAEAGDRECSPGTFIFWDKGYKDHLQEQPFEWAATLLCRIISIPTDDKICIDLGYKSIASENPQPRVYFLNLPDAIPLAHSEEHLVLKVPDSRIFHCGDILYGIPWHICPTVALYEKAWIVINHQIIDSWKIIARDREISI